MRAKVSSIIPTGEVGVKPKEHPLRILVLEICLGMALRMLDMATFRNQMRVKYELSFAEWANSSGLGGVRTSKIGRG